jgi:hypothetical protein
MKEVLDFDISYSLYPIFLSLGDNAYSKYWDRTPFMLKRLATDAMLEILRLRRRVSPMVFLSSILPILGP